MPVLVLILYNRQCHDVLDIVDAKVCGLDAFPAGRQTVQWMSPVGRLGDVVNVVLASI